MALLITTCERDTIEFSDSNSTPQAETKGFVIKSVTINEVKENALIKESLDVIDSQFDFNKTIKSNPSKKQGKQTTSALADPIKSKDNRFTILTDEILEVSTDTTKVYTFRIETPTDTLSKFENFVIHKWSNNKIEYYIYKYNYLDKNQSFLRFTRERVNSDQINTGDFNDYTMGVMYYDPGSDCWISVTSSGGMTYIDASDCGVSAGSGGMSGSGGGAGNNNWYGQWAIVGVTWSNDCIISRAILDAYGNPTFTQNGSPRSQSAVVNCPEGGMNPLNPGQNQSNPWGNSTNPPNIDPLHWDPSNSGGGGGGGGGPSSSSTDGNNQEGTVIAVLPPTRLEREIESFFDNLTEEQKDCLSPGFGQPQNSLKKNITAYFKNNQAFQKFGFDSSTITPEAKAFAKSAITALMEVGIANYSSNDYPGMDDGLPFEWWNDDEFVENNFSFNLAGEGFGDLTTQEKWLVAAFPARALIIYNNKELAETETINRFGNNGRNDKSDAFRHAFFNAMNSNDAGDTVARLFSNAHESEVTSNLILEVQMDLHNNNVGHTIGDDASIFISDQDLSSSVYQSLLNGLLVYLSPLDAVLPPNFGINSSTQIIPTN